MGGLLRSIKKNLTSRQIDGLKLKKDPESVPVGDGGILPVDEHLRENLKNLRQDVESQGTPKVKLIGGSFKTVKLDDVRWTEERGMIFGYMVKENADGVMMRRVFIVNKSGGIWDIPDDERKRIVTAVFDCFLDYGHGEIEIDTPYQNCLVISQEFMPTLWTEGNPNILVPNDPKTKFVQ